MPELWPAVLAKLCALVGGWAGGLLAFDPEQHTNFTATPNYVEAFTAFAENSDHYDNRRPKRALASGHAGFMHDLEMFSQADLDADPIYVDLLYPAGVKWTSGTVIPVPTTDIMVFDISRREVDGPFDRAMMERLDLYRPHLARAALLSHRLGLRAAQAATAAMEAIGLPAAVLGPGGRAISVNAPLEALAPRIVPGAFERLRLNGAGADRMLASALAEMSAVAAPVVRSIPLPASEGEPALIVHVIPLRRAATDIFARATGLLIVTSVLAPAAPLTEVLTGLFDLTPAEVRIARGIATGISIDDIAAGGAISRETVRTQLKAVMAKTGTSRQSELALLLSGASLNLRSRAS